VCKNEATKRWKEANPETNSEMRRETMLKSKYNITIEQYQLMWEEQEGLCAACGEAMPTKDDRGYFPPVDHDHETNKIRGIVHTKCNRGIGLFNDSPDRMRKVADYLERNQ
jgi:hypothetical protein